MLKILLSVLFVIELKEYSLPLVVFALTTPSDVYFHSPLAQYLTRAVILSSVILFVFTFRDTTLLFNSNSYGVSSRTIDNVLWKDTRLYVAVHLTVVSFLIN